MNVNYFVISIGIYNACVLFCFMFQVKGLLKGEWSATASTPVTSVSGVKVTRFHLPQKPEGDISVHAVSVICYIASEDNGIGGQNTM
jgi:hypothetical protein